MKWESQAILRFAYREEAEGLARWAYGFQGPFGWGSFVVTTELDAPRPFADGETVTLEVGADHVAVPNEA